VTLAIDTSRLQGQFSKAARVVWTDPARPPVILTISGTVHEPFTIEPRVAFLEGFPGQQRTVTLTLRNHEAQPLRIEALRSDRSGILVAVEEIAPGQEYRLMVSRDPDLAPGSYRATLELELAGASGGTLRIPVTVIQKRGVWWSRSGVVFRERPAAGLRWPVVTLRVEKHQDPEFRITGIESDLPFLRAELRPLPEEDEVTLYEIEFTLDSAGLPEEAFHGTVTIETSDQGVSRLTLPVMGPGTPAAAVRP
jgi:hypothetical protein